MGSKTYKTRALVLKKTKLREKDLIVSFLAEDGSLLQGVAKGARKPGGSLAGRLEFFSCVDLLMAQGRSLDTVCEARLAGAVEAGALGMEQAAAASPLAELACTVAQPDLPQPRLFDLVRAAFGRIASAGPDSAATFLAAALWKVMAQAGFRPCFGACALCGNGLAADGRAQVVFSVEGGGAVCGDCPRPADALLVDANVVGWCDALMMARFDEVEGFGCDVATALSALHLARAWARHHTGRDLKSLDFLFASGLGYVNGDE